MNSTFIYKVKCLRCGLHFAVYSWFGDWKPQACPECKVTGEEFPNLVWREEVDGEIYTHVPGSTPMIAMN